MDGYINSGWESVFKPLYLPHPYIHAISHPARLLHNPDLSDPTSSDQPNTEMWKGLLSLKAVSHEYLFDL